MVSMFIILIFISLASVEASTGPTAKPTVYPTRRFECTGYVLS